MRGSPGVLCVQWLCLALMLVFLSGVSEASVSEELNVGDAARRCEQGDTIYCLALGMAEARLGKLEDALRHYRLACENHPTDGPLHACTPMFAMSRELGRLAEAAAPLEKRCQSGEKNVCYYLGKEYLKLSEIERAHTLLEPLCHGGYRPPDSKDLGPCFHLGKGLQAREEFARARNLFEKECHEDMPEEHPVCRALQRLGEVEARFEQKGWNQVNELAGANGALALLLVIPLASATAWLFGFTRAGWWYRWVAPILGFVGVLWWWRAPKQFEYFPGDIILILIILTTLSGLVWLSHQKSAPHTKG